MEFSLQYEWGSTMQEDRILSNRAVVQAGVFSYCTRQEDEKNLEQFSIASLSHMAKFEIVESDNTVTPLEKSFIKTIIPQINTIPLKL